MWICFGVFLSTPSLLCSQRSKVKAFLGLETGWGLALPSQSKAVKYKVRVWYFTEGQGLKPGHILTIPFALQAQRWGWKELNVRQAVWGASVTHPLTQMSLCKGAKIISWTGALQSQDLPFLSLLQPFAFSSFVLHTQPSPGSKEQSQRAKNVCKVWFHSEP